MVLQHPLGAGNPRVELLHGIVVEFLGQTTKAQEQRDHGPQVGGEQAFARSFTFVDKRVHPGAQGRRRHRRRRGQACIEARPQRALPGAVDDGTSATRMLAPLQHRSAHGLSGGDIQHHVTGPSQRLGQGHLRHRQAGQHVQCLDAGVAHRAAPRRAGGHADLQRQRPGRVAQVMHRRLHRQRGLHRALRRRRPGSLVIGLVEPAGDGVAGQGQRVATVALYLGDQRVVDTAHGLRQRFHAIALAMAQRKRFGQHGEAADVGKQGGAPCVRRQLLALGQCAQAVGRKIVRQCHR